MKLTKKEKDKIAMQMVTVDRGPTWVGNRPVIMGDKNPKHDKKLARRQGNAICRQAVLSYR